MTQERKQAEDEIRLITEDVRETGCKEAILIAALSYARGLVEGQRLAKMQEETA